MVGKIKISAVGEVFVRDELIAVDMEIRNNFLCWYASKDFAAYEGVSGITLAAGEQGTNGEPGGSIRFFSSYNNQTMQMCVGK